jgi:hypothetical protein
LTNFNFCFLQFGVNGYFQFSTVLPTSVFDTFIGHLPVYLIDVADVDGGKGKVVERRHDGGDGSDCGRVQILFGVLENIVR